MFLTVGLCNTVLHIGFYNHFLDSSLKISSIVESYGKNRYVIGMTSYLNLPFLRPLSKTMNTLRYFDTQFIYDKCIQYIVGGGKV